MGTQPRSADVSEVLNSLDLFLKAVVLKEVE